MSLLQNPKPKTGRPPTIYADTEWHNSNQFKIISVNLPCVRRIGLPLDQLLWLFNLMATLHSPCEYCIASGPSNRYRQIPFVKIVMPQILFRQ